MSFYIDPHIHMISRVTDDYHRMAQCGCVAVSEPAFWAGFDRGTAEGFRDYFRHLTEVEPKRAAQFGIKHYSLAVHQRQGGRERQLSRDVIAVIPEFLDKPNVLGIGEIGLNKNTRNEAIIFQEHVDLAVQDQRADPHPHAAPGGQVQGHAHDHRHAQERLAASIRARVLHRPRRGAHGAAGPGQRLLVRHDAVSDDEMHAAAGRATSSRWSARSASWRTRRATGASPTRWRCRS